MSEKCLGMFRLEMNSSNLPTVAISDLSFQPFSRLCAHRTNVVGNYLAIYIKFNINFNYFH